MFSGGFTVKGYCPLLTQKQSNILPPIQNSQCAFQLLAHIYIDNVSPFPSHPGYVALSENVDTAQNSLQSQLIGMYHIIEVAMCCHKH